MDTTVTRPHSIRATSTRTGGARMPRSNAVVSLCVLLFIPLLALCQVRESGRVQPQAVDSQAQAAGAGMAPGDSFSAGVTGVRVALGPGDLLEISVFDTPELTHRTRVDSDGKITMALIGEINVHGMSPDALEKLIRQKLID